MVFIAQGRGRGNRGRGRGVGEVSFQSKPAASHSKPGAHAQGTEEAKSAESFRITIGNDQFQKRADEKFEDRLDPALTDRLGPPVTGRSYSGPYGRDSGDHYRRDEPGYREGSDRFREPYRGDRDYNERYRHEREPDSRRYPDREVPAGPGMSLFPAGALKGSLLKEAPLYQKPSRTISPNSTGSGSRPLKSILKKKNEIEDAAPPEKKLTPGLAGISNYADDIDDEEKFLYGEDGGRRESYRESQRFQARGAAPPPRSDMRAAAKTWQPSQPTAESLAETVTDVVSKLLSVQQQQTLQQTIQGYSQPQQSSLPQNTGASADGDLWNLLAKSVQTVQEQQSHIGNTTSLGLPQMQPTLGLGQLAGIQTQPSQYQANVPLNNQTVPNPQSEAGYDPTIENILKSIGFDFDMSKRMQEKAKQTQEQPSLKPEEPQFGINQTASFIGSGMSHDEMKTVLLTKGQAGVETLIREAKQNVYTFDSGHVDRDTRDERGRHMSDERDIRSRDVRDDQEMRARDIRDSRDRDSIGSRERERGSRDIRDRESIGNLDRGYRDYEDKRNSENESPVRLSPKTSQKDSPRTRLSAFERDLSPVSAEGSPPPKFDLSPIEIRRKSRLELNRSPGWERAFDDKDRSSRADSRSRRSRSRSWGRIVITAGRGSSRSPFRGRSGSPRRIHVSPPRHRSPSPRRRSLSPRSSHGRGFSPRKRSLSPRRSVSPRRRSPRRSLSPRGRRSLSPRNKRSFSPRRKRSISPGGRRRSPSPKSRKRSLSPHRRSGSPRGRKRSYSPKGHRSRSRDRKIKRSRSRERRRHRSRDQRNTSRSPIKIGSRGSSRSLSVSSTSSDPDNKFYFTAPLQMGPPKRIPSQYYDHPSGPPPGPPTFAPPPGPYPPPYALPPGMPPFGVPPPFGMPPGPPPQFGPPPQDNQPHPPGTEYEMPLTLPSRIYPATLTEIRPENADYPRAESLDRSRRSRSSSRSSGRRGRRRDSRDKRRGRSRDRSWDRGSKDRRSQEKSKERDHKGIRSRDRSKERDRKDKKSRERSRDRDKKDRRSSERSKERDHKEHRSQEGEKTKERDRKDVKSVGKKDKSDTSEKVRETDKKEDKKGLRSSERSLSDSGSSKRSVLPPLAENFEIKASTTSHNRIVIIGGKDKPKSTVEKEKETRSITMSEKKWSAAAEKEKLSKEREKLNNENEERQGKIKTLVTELESLKVQQNELSKSDGGNIDFASKQILIENSKLQVEIQEEIDKLQTEQKQTNEAIAEILQKELNLTEKKPASTAERKDITAKKEDKGKGQKTATEKPPEAVSTVSPQNDKVLQALVEESTQQRMRYYFIDRGCHWCKGCKDVYENLHDYIAHLQTYKHKQTMTVDLKPWKDGFQPNEGKIVNKKGIQIPLPGTEFLIPAQAFYCQICRVFLGDVSIAIDHFRCESHFSKYQNYCRDNPFYEKRFNQEKEAAVIEIYQKQGKKITDAKMANKVENEKKDTKIRQQEKIWDKTVTDLSDDKPSVKSPEVKGEIKLNFAGKSDKDIKVEKGFGKFTWVKQEDKKDVAKETTQTEKEKGDKHDDKKGIAINLTGKSIPVRSTGGVYGKKNPLLPPWQPVGKKSETKFPMRKEGKPEKDSPAGLDMFLTSSREGGKIPVIGEKQEKKKISPKDILEAFSGKYKDKDIQPKVKQDDKTSGGSKTDSKSKKDSTSKTDSISKKNTTSSKIIDLDSVPLPPLKKSKKELQEEKDMKMMGIEPSSTKPIATIKRPPPPSQNMNLPTEKSAGNRNQFHDVFFQDVPLEAIPMPFDVNDKKKQLDPERVTKQNKLPHDSKDNKEDSDHIKNTKTEQNESNDLKDTENITKKSNEIEKDKDTKSITKELNEIEKDKDTKSITKELNEIEKDKDTKSITKELNEIEKDEDTKHITKESNEIEKDKDTKRLTKDSNEIEKDTKTVQVDNKIETQKRSSVSPSKSDMKTDTANEGAMDEKPDQSPVTRSGAKPRGRGRGRRRGRGRGAKSTRTTRATVVAEETTPVTINNKDTKETETDPNPKRARQNSGKDDAHKSDADDNASNASGISMHMGSDFEVVDDIADVDSLDV